METESTLKIKPQKLDVDLEAIEQYRVIREYVEHEDKLVNFRISWFLAIHAVFLGGFGLTFGELSKQQSNFLEIPGSFVLVTWTLAAFALAICDRANKTVNAAMQVIDGLAYAYNDYFTDRGFPPLAGGFQRHHLNVKNTYLPRYFRAFWLFIGLAITGLWVLQNAHDVFQYVGYEVYG